MHLTGIFYNFIQTIFYSQFNLFLYNLGKYSLGKIGYQFLIEALILSTIGGLIGTTTGLSGGFLLSLITPLPASVGITTTFPP